MRDTARAPQPPTNQPTGHQMSRKGLYVPKKAYFWEKWPFWAKYPNYFMKEQKFRYPLIRKPLRHIVCIVLSDGHGSKWIRKANIWPKMTKIAYFGSNFFDLGPKILILTGGSKILAPCSHCFLVGQGIKFAKNANSWPKLPVLGQIWLFLTILPNYYGSK